MVAACLSLCLLGGFSANGGIKADAAATTQETSVTQIIVDDTYGFWLGLSGTDYGTTGTFQNEKNYDPLKTLSTLNKIKIDGNYIANDNSTISGSVGDPYINLWGKLAGSFRLSKVPKSEVIVEKGCQFPSLDYWKGNADGVIYEVKETVTFKKSESGVWAMVLPETDISDTFSVTAGKNDKDSAVITLSTTADVSAPSSETYLMDNMTEIQNYLTVNGKTVAEINAETDDSSYVYTEFPGSLGGVYAVPVRVSFVKSGNNSEFRIRIHNEYYKTLPENFTVGMKAGFVRGNTAATANMTVKTDVSINIVKADATVNFFNALNGGSSNGYYHAYVYTDLFKGNLLGYAMIDGGYKYLTDYVYINDQSVNDINKNTDTTGWDWSTSYPQSVGDTYHVPVMLYVSANTDKEYADKGATRIEIKIHENYMKSVEGDLTLTMKGGINLFDNTNKTMYGIGNDAVGSIYYKTYKLTINVDGKDTVLDAKHTMPLDFTNFCQEKTGYTFSGWFTDSALTTAATETTMPASNYTVYGKYNAIEYTAKIVLGDGSEQNVTYTIENRAAKLEEMKGLLSEDDAQYAYTNDLPTELPLENGKTYTESRTVKEYDVVIGDAAAVKKAYGSKLEKPQNDPTKTKLGYTVTFDGWYNGDAKWNFENDTVTGDVTLVAKFNETVNTYSATLNLADGSSQTITYTIENRTEKLAEAKALLSADNAQYAYTNDLPTELPLENGKTYTESRTVKEYDVVIGDAAAVKKAYGSKLEKPQDPTKANTAEKVYAFDGWYNGETKWNFETDTVTGDVILVAKFTESARRYTVTINFTGLNKEQVQLTLEYGKKVDFTAYNENGYTFVIKNGEEKITEFTITGDATLTVEYAKVQAAKKGCKGSIGGSAAVLAMLGFAALALKKKNK